MDKERPLIWLLVVITLMTAALQLVNTSLSSTPLNYNRAIFTTNIYWQWLTPNLVHLNWSHWFVNCLNLFTVVLLFSSAWSIKTLLLHFSGASLVVTLGLYLFSEEVINYAGMSGVVYALALYGGLKTFPKQKYISGAVLIFVMLQLLVGEKLQHLLHINIFLQNMTVIRDAHWYGGLFGLTIYIITLSQSYFSDSKHSQSD